MKVEEKYDYENQEDENMNVIIAESPKRLDCVIKMQRLATKVIKDKGLTEKQVRKSLGLKRYEK